ncbi:MULTISPECIES: sulfurtransferase [Acinetobacter]|uniref:Rhodanese-like domain-containing protein n=1 Tax=Acinetobacter johnsonii TaxID=40214 RepID=A0AAJ6LAT7_ACIJO|nr:MULTISPECIES: rhodanese-like domain-containing protein [Acinetobacter]ALV71530.1 thiosulfate sulfurtransferase [Acinetobacter johnsonii XBB1]MBC6678180.1 sulfurtransferase [Acinetobacter sp.]MDH1531601.1 rhodanese-like domain-containing protein [Acinetobacter johnsonii]PZO93792.1 MAG: sulfurtransferase [Acinetobacter johnsonii]WMG19192.1 rhodanese-like domain-containing protein [Acinetobacter johnsonii]
MTHSAFDFGLLIDAEQLVPHLGNDKLRIVDLSRASVYDQLHIPHALHLKPKFLVRQDEQATGLLPDVEGLQELIRYLNISPEHHVVVYDDEGGAWAGRLIWNLNCLGFENTSLLNGGIHAWLAAGLPTTSEVEQFEPVRALVQVDQAKIQQYRIEYAELLEKVQSSQVQLWDCRTEDEYTGLRLAARRGGHIPNALHFEWSTALNRENHLRLHPLERTQQRLEQLGFNLNEPVVVYCQSHHRSGLAYILGRLLGWNIQAYDGAWSEWGNRLDSPIITGEMPS